MRLSLLLAGPLAVAASIGCALPATLGRASWAVADSFRLGTNTSLFCRVQSRLTDDVLATMFDRAYSIVCRDAAQAVSAMPRSTGVPSFIFSTCFWNSAVAFSLLL